MEQTRWSLPSKTKTDKWTEARTEVLSVYWEVIVFHMRSLASEGNESFSHRELTTNHQRRYDEKPYSNGSVDITRKS